MKFLWRAVKWMLNWNVQFQAGNGWVWKIQSNFHFIYEWRKFEEGLETPWDNNNTSLVLSIHAYFSSFNDAYNNNLLISSSAKLYFA